jgi:hypothetical protein
MFPRISQSVSGSVHTMVQHVLHPHPTQDYKNQTLSKFDLSKVYIKQGHGTALFGFSCPVAWANYLTPNNIFFYIPETTLTSNVF